MIAAPPPAALTAAPARIELAGAANAALQVTNPGHAAVVVDARPAGFALDLRGRPCILVRRDLAARVTVQPRRVALRPGETASISVSSVLRAHARAGDHPALVLLTTHPRGTGGVGVRMQLGVVVMVHVPGVVVHRLELGVVRLRRAHVVRVLDVSLRNQGNVTENVGPRSLRVVLRRGGRVLATLRPAERELLPGARGIVRVRWPARVRGGVSAVVEFRAREGVLVRRIFRLRSP